MGVIGGEIGYRILRGLGPSGMGGRMDGAVYANRSKLEVLLGPEVWVETRDKVVIDFGCGSGMEAVEIAERGARRVIGIDLQEDRLAAARRLAAQRGMADRCQFSVRPDTLADVIISIDSFEHFDDPAAILEEMYRLLRPGGCVLVSFGPTWYHPLGGHLFSVFPWAHLLFTERALIRWRSDFKSDGATRFSEVAGGLNQMTIRRFERLVRQSPFRLEHFEAVPIRKLRPLAVRLTREFTTAIVRCKLVAEH